MSVSARAVDMLGRQQIAGIPTAIHELFKNAHDAYANNTEIDYFQQQDLITLRDDGIGMTEEDFLKKWLTIGTSSKYGVNRKSEFIPKGMQERKLMGEKGIGRLAIASIGRQVIVLSRAERDDGMHDLVVALIHWSQFEIPDIGVTDIVIPTRTFQDGELPTESDLHEMSLEISENLLKLKDLVPDEIMNLILTDFDKLKFSPASLMRNLQQKTIKNWERNNKEFNKDIKNQRPPVLDGIGKGTSFIIIPCDEALALDVKSNSSGTTELQKILVGFSNSLSRNSDKALDTKFRLHQGGEESELIEAEFFTDLDNKNADHVVEGAFDEFGQFCGKVTVYKGTPQPHIINWDKAFGTPTRCGPFKIKFSYLQGEVSESLVPADTYVEINSKLKMYGGLYVYKDGIRVLPYGKQEFDFLKFEEKRSKNAGMAFFSHRLMFGAIEIEHDINTELQEKAGREGFIENKAYRDFKSILENFFEQLAIDFFRDNSANDRFSELKNRLKEEHKIAKAQLERRKKLAAPKKEQFQRELRTFFDKLKGGEFASNVNDFVSSIDRELNKARGISNKSDKYNFISELQSTISSGWKKLFSELKITKPKVRLNKDITKEWESYLKSREKLKADVYDPSRIKLEGMVSEYVKFNELSFSVRDRINGQLEEEKKTLAKNISNYRSELKGDVKAIDSLIKEQARQKSSEYTNALSSVVASVNSASVDTLSEEEASELLISWEKQLEEINLQTEQYFTKMRDTVELVLNDLNHEESSSTDLIAALENENEQTKESLNQYFDFAQLGMSLGIIQHEFSSTASNVRNSIKSLKPWADKNPKLGNLYKNISRSFEHLDGYLKMFTPLNRRLYRSKVELSGKEIEAYLRDIFQKRLTRHNITLKVSDEFKIRTTSVYPSSFLPVFINVIDNAIYWLNSQSEKENPDKIIELDIDKDALTISNNGPKIDPAYSNRIFDFTFSRKKNGRGMGLYISKETLNNEGFEIDLVNQHLSSFPCFAIRKSEEGVSYD